MSRSRARGRADETSAAPRGSRAHRVENRAAAAAAWAGRPAVYPLLLALVVVAGVLVRLPGALDESAYFRNHDDEASYFNQAYAGYRSGGERLPLAHGGSGLSLFLEIVFDIEGVGPGGPVRQLPAAGSSLEPETLAAARLAYVVNALLGGGVVVATILLARLLLPPLGVLAAATFAAFDPLLVDLSGQLMTESAYTACFVLSVAAAVASRRHPAWLLAAGPLMAFAHMLRVNGLVMLGMVLLFAFLLHRARGRVPWKHLAGAVALFLLVATPYLLWRADHLPGAFDYGTNQRYWVDRNWDFSDDYWQNYSYSQGGPKETMADYFATHTAGDAAHRLYHSVKFQFDDLFVGGYLGGGAVLQPFLTLLAPVALLRLGRERAWWAFPLGLLVTFLTFLWIYPMVRSVRYFAPLVPLAIPLAVAGLPILASWTRTPWAAAAAVVAAFLAFFAIDPLWGVFEGGLAGLGDFAGWVTGFLVTWLAIAVGAPAWEGWMAWRARREPPGG